MPEKKSMIAIVVRGVGLLQFEDDRSPEDLHDEIIHTIHDCDSVTIREGDKIHIYPISELTEIQILPFHPKVKANGTS